jgi:hypothetical protein
MPVLWRTKLRSSLAGIDHAEQVEHCIHGGVVGIAWRMDELGATTTLDEACTRIENPRLQETVNWPLRSNFSGAVQINRTERNRSRERLLPAGWRTREGPGTPPKPGPRRAPGVTHQRPRILSTAR